jgi:putative DNA primase/helicase
LPGFPLGSTKPPFYQYHQQLTDIEGIETALACTVQFDLPVWSAINSTMLAKWNPPPGVRMIHIFSDNDANFVGQEASYKLAKRLSAEGLEVKVHIPDGIGDDWAD